MRLFACSLLESAERAFYDATVRRLVDGHGRLLRPIPSESAHVTYAFIPRLDDAQVPVAVEAMRSTASRLEPVRVTIGDPKVVFAGREARLIDAPIVDGGPTLVRIADEIAGALEMALPGVPISRSRSPHVTLARFRRGTSRRAAQPVVDALAGRDEVSLRHVRFTDVQLVSSELTAERPIYAVLACVELGPTLKA